MDLALPEDWEEDAYLFARSVQPLMAAQLNRENVLPDMSIIVVLFLLPLKEENCVVMNVAHGWDMEKFMRHHLEGEWVGDAGSAVTNCRGKKNVTERSF